MSAPDQQSASQTPSPVAMSQPAKTARHGVVGGILAGLVIAMLGLSYAAVPLYKIFCQVTGYAGTTQRAKLAPEKATDQMISVRFDANISRDLDWQFKPLQRVIKLKIGEEKLAFYTATNNSSEPITGTATFNVTPAVAGSYFNKIACFCFTEQTLQPGESVEMPVSFFIDPDMLNDPDMKSVREITLSYTFFEVKKQKTAQTVQKGKTGNAKGSL
jgi:cytochrome c oxidase assembly protein subunit 11